MRPAFPFIVYPQHQPNPTPIKSTNQMIATKVFLVRERHSGKIYAMKVLNKSNIIKRNQVRAPAADGPPWLHVVCLCPRQSLSKIESESHLSPPTH